MSTATANRARKCEAEGGPSNCKRADCPERMAFYASYAAVSAPEIQSAVSRPSQPRKPSQRPTQLATGEGNFTASRCRKIAAEMREHGTQDSYLHEIMMHAQSKHSYLLAVTRDEHGPSGYMEFHIERSPIMPEVVVHNVRARQSYQGEGNSRDSKGAGLALLQHAAQVAVAQKNPKTVLVIQGAVDSARPFYAKMGGRTSATNSIVNFSREATEALAAGHPISLAHPQK